MRSKVGVDLLRDVMTDRGALDIQGPEMDDVGYWLVIRDDVLREINPIATLLYSEASYAVGSLFLSMPANQAGP